ncbi:hypothetical protein E1176_04295 [Fulvivirga sp. RKSG066]|nr:hypothetical protein [Fulvivirga aurantia]
MAVNIFYSVYRYDMKWIYSLKEKVKIALALAVVFLLVLMTNTINKNHFAELQESFTSVYKDRLLVENYIYKLSHELNTKRVNLFNHVNASYNLTKANERIDALITNFENTLLTEDEAKLLDGFVEHVERLKQIETAYIKNDDDAATYRALQKQFNLLNNDLSLLSDIQLEEGERLLESSNNIVATNHWYAQLEIILLISIGLVIQALIFASKSLKPKVPQNEQLN